MSNMKKEQILTWYDLKKIVNDMTGAQLGMPVKVWGENFAFKITELDILEDDYVDGSGEGVEPAFLYSEEELEDVSIRYNKDQPVLWAEKN